MEAVINPTEIAGRNPSSISLTKWPIDGWVNAEVAGIRNTFVNRWVERLAGEDKSRQEMYYGDPPGVPGFKLPQNTKDRSIYVENKSASFSKSNEPLVTFAWQKLLLPHDKFQIKLLKNCELKCANTVQTGAAAPEKLHQGFVASKMGLETDKEIWGGTRRVTCGSNNSFSQIFLSGC